MKLYFLIILFILAHVVKSQSIIDSAIEKEFIEYINKEKNIKKSNFGFYLSEIPVPIKPNFSSLIINKNTFVDKYDLRTLNQVTSVKNQGGCGGCWNFVTMGAIESNLIKNNLGIYDLSEQNLRTCHKYEFTNDGSCSAGNHLMASAYLVRHNGPILESEDPFNTNPYATCNENFNPIYFFDEVQFLPNDTSVLKQTIIDYGGIYASMYWSDVSYNTISKNYYYNGSEPVNHAVLIIGWDNNRNTSAGKGAWIVKNSWGTTWGENGYFYISYKDSKVLTSAAIFKNYSPSDSSLKYYFYDKLGYNSSTGYNTDSAFALVKYNSSSKSLISAIGTYINSTNSNIDIEIYTNKIGNDLVNLIANEKNIHFTYPGYYKINLSKPPQINTNENFYIKVKYKTPNYKFPIPVEKQIPLYAMPEIEKNVCWISSNAKIWEKLGSDISGNEKDLCIRAYCIPDTIINISDNKINIYPNPNKGILNVHFSNINSSESSIKIFNTTGNIVYNELIINSGNAFIKRIDMLNFSSGIYIVEINSGTTIYKNKFSLIND